MRRTDRDLVSASELAQLGYCERVAHFDWRYGAKRSPEQLVAQDRGIVAHDQFYQDSLAIARAGVIVSFQQIDTVAADQAVVCPIRRPGR